MAAVSDIHGNLGALDAVLADIAMRGVDLTVNLGDLLSGGLQPLETADRLIPLGLPTARGNHERQVLTLSRERMGASDRLAADSMTTEHRDWLLGLPMVIEPVDGVMGFHGTPTDDTTYLLETVDQHGARRATRTEVLQRLGADHEHPLLLCGHTHLQRSMRLPQGGLVVNPGSVGWPAYAEELPHPHVMQAGTPHARYAIADDGGGRWQVTFLQVDYDWNSAAAVAVRNGRPDVARALLTGTV